jgi:hypothetical protein
MVGFNVINMYKKKEANGEISNVENRLAKPFSFFPLPYPYIYLNFHF